MDPDGAGESNQPQSDPHPAQQPLHGAPAATGPPDQSSDHLQGAGDSGPAHDAAAAPAALAATATAQAATSGMPPAHPGPPAAPPAIPPGAGPFANLELQLPLASEAPHVQAHAALTSPAAHQLPFSPSTDLMAMLASPNQGGLSAAASGGLLLPHTSETLEAVAAAAAAELQQRRLRRSRSGTADPTAAGQQLPGTGPGASQQSSGQGQPTEGPQQQVAAPGWQPSGDYVSPALQQHQQQQHQQPAWQPTLPPDTGVLQQYHSDPMHQHTGAQQVTGSFSGPVGGTAGAGAGGTGASAGVSSEQQAVQRPPAAGSGLSRVVTGPLPQAPSDSFSSGAGTDASQQHQLQRQGQALLPPVLQQQQGQHGSVTGPLAAVPHGSPAAAAAGSGGAMQLDTLGSSGQGSPAVSGSVAAAAAATAAAAASSGGGGGTAGGSSSGLQQQQQQQQQQEVFTHTRQLTCKTYLKRLNVTQFMSDHMLPCMEGSLRSSSHKAGAATTAAQRGTAATAATAAAESAGGQESDTEADQRTGSGGSRSTGAGSRGSRGSRGRQGGQGKSYELMFKVQVKLVDPTGFAWPVVYEGVMCAGQRHLRLTCGWSEFIRARKLGIGDSITFERRGSNRSSLVVYAQQQGKEPEVPYQGPLPEDPQLKVLTGSMRGAGGPASAPGAAAAAAAAASGEACGSGDSSGAGASRAAAGGRTSSRRSRRQQPPQQRRRRGKRGREFDTDDDTEEEDEQGEWELEEQEGGSSYSSGRRAKSSSGRGSAAAAAAAAAAQWQAGSPSVGLQQQQQQLQDSVMFARTGSSTAWSQQLRLGSPAPGGSMLAAGSMSGPADPGFAAAAAAAAAVDDNQVYVPGLVPGPEGLIAGLDGVLSSPQRQLLLQQPAPLLSALQLSSPAGSLQRWPSDQGMAPTDMGSPAAAGTAAAAAAAAAGAAATGGGSLQRRWQQQASMPGASGGAAAAGRPQRLGELAAYNRLAAALGSAHPHPQQQQQQQQQQQVMATRSNSAPVGGGLPQGWQVSTGFLGGAGGSATFGSPSLLTPALPQQLLQPQQQPQPPMHALQQQQQQVLLGSGPVGDAAAAIAASSSWNEPRGTPLLSAQGYGRTSSNDNNAAAHRGSSGGGSVTGLGGSGGGSNHPLPTPFAAPLPPSGLDSFGSGPGLQAAAAAAAAAADAAHVALALADAGSGGAAAAAAAAASANTEGAFLLPPMGSGPMGLLQGPSRLTGPGGRDGGSSQGAAAYQALLQQWAGERQQQHIAGLSSAAAAEILRRPRSSGEALQQLEALLDPEGPWDPSVLGSNPNPGPAALAGQHSGSSLPPQSLLAQQQLYQQHQQARSQLGAASPGLEVWSEPRGSAAGAVGTPASQGHSQPGSSQVPGWHHSQQALLSGQQQGQQHQQPQRQGEQQQQQNEAWGGSLMGFYDS